MKDHEKQYPYENHSNNISTKHTKFQNLVTITLATLCSLKIRQTATTIVQCTVLYDVMLLEDIIYTIVFLPKHKFNDIKKYLIERGKPFSLPSDRYGYLIV